MTSKYTTQEIGQMVVELTHFVATDGFLFRCVFCEFMCAGNAQRAHQMTQVCINARLAMIATNDGMVETHHHPSTRLLKILTGLKIRHGEIANKVWVEAFAAPVLPRSLVGKTNASITRALFLAMDEERQVQIDVELETIPEREKE